ncbi:spirocyclase AveC family protein [Mycobacterium numidiamassiliense]|nr:spirocyclase AveC family protein [Mycobacterium numidiamassiliense]
MTRTSYGVLAAGPLPPSNAAWLMEIGGWIVFGLVAVFLLYRWRKNGQPDTAALLFIGCFTMWWQEFYADWGAYLYYNPDLALLSWGKTPYTTPNKPVYVLAGYGWFYAGGFAAVLTLFRWFRRRYSSVNYVAALLISVFIPFMLWNFVTADGVSYVTNWFQYLESIGPTIHTDKGGLQLIYQGVPLGIFAVAVVASLDRRDVAGRTWFERALDVRPVITSWGERAHQIVAWIVGMNVLYGVFLTLPLVIARILFFPNNSWIPNP